MPMSEQRKQYLLDYHKEKVRRVSLDLSHEAYEQLKAAADNAGESMNGFIKKAINERIERLNEN